MHTCIHPFIHICLHTLVHTCIHAFIHICMHAYKYIMIHAYMHTCTHAYMHTLSLLRRDICALVRNMFKLRSRGLKLEAWRLGKLRLEACFLAGVLFVQSSGKSLIHSYSRLLFVVDIVVFVCMHACMYAYSHVCRYACMHVCM